MSSFEQTLKRYFIALDAGDLEGVLTVFAEGRGSPLAVSRQAVRP